MNRRGTVFSFRACGLVAGLVLGAAHALAQPAEPPPGKSKKDQEV